MKRHRWTPVEVPWVRQALVNGAAAEAARVQGLQTRTLAIGRPDIAEAFNPQIWHTLQHRLAQAGLWWVTREMATVAMDAATDVPSLRAEDAPAPDGLICFQSPLPPYPTQGFGGLALRDGQRTDIPYDEPVPIDALIWACAGEQVTLWLCCRKDRLPLPLTPNDGPLIPWATLTAPLPAALDGPTTTLSSEGVTSGSHARGVLSLLSACWVLMMMPTVANRRTMDASTGGAASERTRPERLVTLVDLRPPKHVVTEGDEQGSGRTLTSRHVVRGHWTMQPHGPNRSLRRPQWIETYIRGPKDAPLIVREQVMVWRR